MRASSATSLTSLFCFALLAFCNADPGLCQSSWGSSGGYSSSGGRVVYVTSHHATPVRNLLARTHQRIHGHLHSGSSVGSWGSSGGSSGGASWGSSGGSSGGTSWGSSGGASWGSASGMVMSAPVYGTLPAAKLHHHAEEEEEKNDYSDNGEEDAEEDGPQQEQEADESEEEEDRTFEEEADEADKSREESTSSPSSARTQVASTRTKPKRASSDVDELGLSRDFYLKAAKVHRALEQERVAESEKDVDSKQLKKTIAKK